MKNWIWNPKTKGSGVITCIPQIGRCPHECSDCFFQSGRSYLEPLENNLPHIPPLKLSEDRIVRMNDGNDSNVDRELVEKTARQFKNYFFNTSVNYELDKFSAPVVLTINPSNSTDINFQKVEPIPQNLMFVRFRTNMWNVGLLDKAVLYYSKKEIPIVITFMAYYSDNIPKEYKSSYIWKKRTLNSYWVLRIDEINRIMETYKENQYVYSCGIKGQHSCKFCGNCIREYYNTKERMLDKLL